MTRLASLGVRPLINAAGAYTRLGGSRLAPGVIEAMAEAAGIFVDYADLAHAVGSHIALTTRNEACIVSNGAAAGIAVAVAACIARDDPARIAGFPVGAHEFEVIVQETQRNGFEYSAQMTGAQIRWIGAPSRAATLDDLRAAMSPRTACVLVFAGSIFEPAMSLPLLIEEARALSVPVVVDAADQIPPIRNLTHFTRELGADLVVFSGGKALRGPQATGLVIGRKDLIDLCYANSNPRISFGRPMKVGKEELLGIAAAVEWALGVDEPAFAEKCESVVDHWVVGLTGVRGVQASRGFPSVAGQPLPRAVVAFAGSAQRDRFVRLLRDGHPRVEVGLVDERAIALNPQFVADDEVGPVLTHVRAAIERLAP